MLGNIFFLLQKFLQKELGASTWNRVFAEAGLDSKFYMPDESYADEEAIRLLRAAGRLTGRPMPELIEAFGRACGPDLIGLFRSLIQPEWKTLDILEHIEESHAIMRGRNPLADPPMIQCVRLSETEAQLTYSSKRRLCILARGMIRGLAAMHGEDVEIHEHSCMHRGYPFCTFQVTVVPRPIPSAGSEVTTPHTPSGGMAIEEISNPWAALSPFQTDRVEITDSEAEEMPSRVMQYRILRRLGAGGMGVVYLAEDGILGRQVAVKLMLPSVAAAAENRERFLREARAMAALASDHIVAIHQVDRHADRPFIVMPWLRGRTLEERLLDAEPLSYPEIVRIGREIALGLAAAHEAGLVHRDVKPSNIWLEDPGQRVKILDFGMARSDQDGGHLTQAGIRLGTPLYMSPEQAAGDPVDARSDLFSLGVILYRMCSGRTPFQGDRIIALLRSIAVDNPQSLAEIVPDIPPDLSAITMRLLARDPADRPASAHATAEALMAPST